ncbi:hypothetical protein QQ056_01865 [Oscillatoria laete-virens NRMC-F 0139]|nr:hypothetical protein [Oscillatoria laete-virens]MDL5052315.1 hypothetical protein [Oscillatoria laete-virens NRMC-F 0139]
MNQVKLLLLLTGLLLTSFILMKAGSNKPPITVRVHVEVDRGQMRAIPIQLSNPPQTFLVSQFADVTEKDIASVHIYEGPNGPGAKVQLDHRGILALDTVTTANKGRLMVIIVNERPVAIERIEQPIKDGVISFESIYMEEADILRRQYGKKKKDGKSE